MMNLRFALEKLAGDSLGVRSATDRLIENDITTDPEKSSALLSTENTKNEIREKYNKSLFSEQYDEPEGSQGQPDGSQFNPMYTQSVENGVSRR